jgi:O-antigen ligase
MSFLNSLRKLLLFFALVLLSIPGFKSIELSFLGLSLGLFQPFKLAYMAWLVTQAGWVLVTEKGRTGRLFWISILLLDLALASGLFFEEGGPHGRRIFTSLLLGQAGALLCILDRSFPVKWMVAGFLGASFVLLGFAGAERFFPDSPWLLAFLGQVRDGPLIGSQPGSSLSTSGLAEFCIRAFPLVALYASRSLPALLASGILAGLGIFTVERGALLAFLLMLGVWLLSPTGKKHRKKILAAGGLALITAVLFVGPGRAYSRYFGWIGTQDPNSLAGRSQTGITERVLLGQAAVHAIATHPLTGIGLDGVLDRITRRVPPMEKTHMLPHHSHNLILEMGASGGVPALVAFLFLIMSYGLATVRRPIHWVALLYFSGQLVSMNTDCRIYVSWLSITFFWFAGMAWTLGETTEAIPQSIQNPP